MEVGQLGQGARKRSFETRRDPGPFDYRTFFLPKVAVSSKPPENLLAPRGDIIFFYIKENDGPYKQKQGRNDRREFRPASCESSML